MIRFRSSTKLGSSLSLYPFIAITSFLKIFVIRLIRSLPLFWSTFERILFISETISFFSSSLSSAASTFLRCSNKFLLSPPASTPELNPRSFCISWIKLFWLIIVSTIFSLNSAFERVSKIPFSMYALMIPRPIRLTITIAIILDLIPRLFIFSPFSFS